MKLTGTKPFRIVTIASFTAAVLFGFLLNQRHWFELCFQNRIIENLEVVKTKRKPVAEQTVLFIFDDLSEATAERNLGRLEAKAEKEGFVTTVNLDSFTFTIAGVYTLGTGDQPSLVQVQSDFLSAESVTNNIFENVQSTGKKTFHIGEALWMDNFKRGIDDSFTSRDLGLFIKYGTDKMMAQFGRALSNKENGLI
ncbi:MAG: hypothetical protein JW795_21050, partial [Chitinivibrionales bacterium]|nr:hypothetical protein [Chitinivibrionales bacterium]